MKRKLIIGLGIFFGLIGLILLSVAAILYSEAGNRWALSKVPGLEVQGFQGKLLGDWSAEQISWQQDDTKALLLQPKMHLSGRCLMQKRICINHLEVAEIQLELPEETEPTPPRDADLDLPALKLPIEIEIKRLAVNRLLLNQQPLVTGLEAQLAWLNSGVSIDHLVLHYTDIALQAQGTLDPATEVWATELELQAVIPLEPEAEPLTAKLQASGPLNQLQLTGLTSGYLQGTLSGEVDALAVDLPLTATLEITDFNATPEQPSLTVERLGLSAQGNLKQGFSIQSEGRLKGDTEPVLLDLKAFAQLDQARIEQLTLQGADPQQYIKATGNLSWQDQLQAQLRLDWQAFPWQQLLPGEPLPVTLDQLTAELELKDETYQGQLDASLTGPEGVFTLSAPVTGNFQQLLIKNLQLVAGQGRLAGDVQVGFAEQIDWLAEINLHELNPAYWVQELPGTLAGTLTSKGQLQGEALTADAELALKGKLRNQQTELLLSADAKPDQYRLQQLQLLMGSNRINAKGSLVKQQVKADLNLDLAQLSQLWPDLSGVLKGQAEVSGSLDQPILNAKLNGQKVTYDTFRIQQLMLDAKLSNQQQLNLASELTGIESGETDLGKLALKASGKLAQHQLQLDLTGPTLNTALAVAGGVNQQGDWRGQLQRMFIAAEGQRFTLDQATQINYLHSGKLTVSAHCWNNQEASLCAERQQQLLPEPNIDYRLRNFSLASLQEFLPEDIKLSGKVNGQLQLALPAAGPKGKIYLDASNGLAEVKDQGQWQQLAWKTLTLDSDLTPQKVLSRVQFKGATTGALTAEISLNPQPADKPISGRFTLSEVDLSVLKPFVTQVEQLEGKVAGQGVISGSLMAPQVTGVIALKQGLLAGGDLPMEMKNLALEAKIAGSRVDLTGGWNSGAKGQGEVGGYVQWEPSLDVNVLVKGTQLPVVVEPYADVIVEPDLVIELADNRLQINGVVRVPKGQIEVPQLPASATRVSPDARIVGEQEPEPGMQMAMDVTIEVGEERLKFNGFGLTADIKGHLKMGDNMASYGQLALANGRYNAYGQRLEIRKAQLLFEGPISEPFLDIEAVRVTGDVTAGLRLSGPASQPASEIFSDPSMSQEQALSWLLLGRPLDGGGDGNAMAQAALALGLMGSSPVVNKLAETVGLKEFSLDSEGSGDATSVAATGKINDKLSMRYGVGVFEPSTILSLRYELTKRLYIEAASGVANSIDLFYKRSF